MTESLGYSTREIFSLSNLLFHGANVIASIEDVDIEVFRRAGLEEAEVVHRLAVIAHHRHVIRYADHYLVIQPALAIVAAVA